MENHQQATGQPLTQVTKSALDFALSVNEQLAGVGTPGKELVELWERELDEIIGQCLAFASAVVHRRCTQAGWWSDIKTGEFRERNVGEILMLKASELAEAMEGHRKGLMDDHLPHRTSFEVELGDVFIRLLDTSSSAYKHKAGLICGLAPSLPEGYAVMDVAGAVVDKLRYNRQRADHKVENRLQEGGKSY